MLESWPLQFTYLRDSACVTLDGLVRIAAEGHILAPTVVAGMENVTLNLESVSVNLSGLQSIAQLQLLAVRTLALGTYFCSKIHTRISSIHSKFRTTGTVFVTTQPENVSAFRPGQVLIVLNVACPVLWIVLVIETPLEVVV